MGGLGEGGWEGDSVDGREHLTDFQAKDLQVVLNCATDWVRRFLQHVFGGQYANSHTAEYPIL